MPLSPCDKSRVSIDQELVTLLQQAYQSVLALLQEQLPALAELVQLLEQKESLDGQAVREVLAWQTAAKAAPPTRTPLVAASVATLTGLQSI